MQNDDLLTNVTEVAGSKVLPPCVILGRLGRGGMGAVYRARHLNLAIDVAVKVLKPQLVADDPSFVARFKREGQSAAAISHQNVIRVFDVAEYVGIHYIIMELVVGETARQRVERRGPLPLAEAMQVLRDAAHGLGAAHALGIVHRDVKPDNLLIASSGQLKVADLGLAKPTMGTGGASLMSAANQVMGTPSYMPPEQWESPAVGPAADVWALGATLYYLLTGEEAFDSRDGNYPRVMKQIVLQPFPDLRQKCPDVPDGVVALLAKATAKDPAARFADANEFAQAIEDLGMPRVSLRDRTDTSEARTMVSPQPKNLEQIKQWLREDNLKRLQAPASRGGKAAPLPTPPMPPPGRNPGAASREDGADRTLVSPTPKPPTIDGLATGASGGRRGFVYAAVLLIAAGGAAYWQFGRGSDNGGAAKPQVDKFAEVDRLETGARWREATEALAALLAAEPELQSPPQNQRLARLRVEYARQLEQAGQWKSALAEVGRAVQLDASKEPSQAALRRKIAEEAQRLVSVTPSTITRGAAARFTVKLPLDAVESLRLDAQPLERGEADTFVKALQVGSAEPQADSAELPLDGVLTDQSPLQLRPHRVTITPAPKQPALSFVTQPAAETFLPGNAVFTPEPTITLRGRLDVVADELRLGDERLDTAWQPDGSFETKVPIDVEGAEVEVVLTAVKAGHVAARSEAQRVVRLSALPEFRVVEPAANARIEAMRTNVVVTGLPPWTQFVRVRRGEGLPESLQRRPGDPTTFVGSYPLVAGDTPLTIVAELSTLTRSQQVPITATYAAAEITGVDLVVGNRRTPLARDGSQCVAERNFRLEATTSGTKPVLRLDAAPCTGIVELSDQTEGPRTFQFDASNESGKRDRFTTRIVVDTTPPEILFDSTLTSSPIAADQEFESTGTWRDANGCDSVLVDGKPATVLPGNGTEGRWASGPLPGRTASGVIKVVARDKAGNTKTFDQAITIVAPKPKVTPDPNAPAQQQFQGFESAPPFNKLGFPKRLVDRATGIELIAVPFPDDKKPLLYIGKRPVTVRQYSGTGADSPQTAITARDVANWLRRNPRFDLLKPEEWAGIGANPDIDRAESLFELLLPPRGLERKSFPVCKDPERTEYKDTQSLGNLGFRVVYRP